MLCCTECQWLGYNEKQCVLNVLARLGVLRKFAKSIGPLVSKKRPHGAPGEKHMEKSWRPKLQNRCLIGRNTFE